MSDVLRILARFGQLHAGHVDHQGRPSAYVIADQHATAWLWSCDARLVAEKALEPANDGGARYFPGSFFIDGVNATFHVKPKGAM